jgi:sulfur carrier protein
VIRVNGKDHDTAFDSVEVMMADLKIDSRGVAVAVNGEIVRRGEWNAVRVADGDVVEIVSAVAGG